jgi:hypothetical protein
MERSEIKKGMRLTFGIDHPRDVEVIGVPFERSGRMLVLCEYATGYTVEAPLTLLFPIKKRPSARRLRGTVSVRDVVEEFNKAGGSLTDEQVVAALKKHGVCG